MTTEIAKEFTQEDPRIEVSNIGRGQQIVQYHWKDGGRAVYGHQGLLYLDRWTNEWRKPDEKTKELYRKINTHHNLPTDF